VNEVDDSAERVGGRYCKDHAGMILQVEGFHWRGGGRGGEKEGIWVDFAGRACSDPDKSVCADDVRIYSA
jgi:hypothetical protein